MVKILFIVSLLWYYFTNIIEGDMDMLGKQLAYELTMEYIKQNNMMKCQPEDIPSQISQIAKVSELICNGIKKEYHNIKFL